MTGEQKHIIKLYRDYKFSKTFKGKLLELYLIL